MKKPVIYLMLLSLGMMPFTLFAKEKPKKIDYKKVCKETKAELKSIKKESAELQEKRNEINEKLISLKTQYEDYRRRLNLKSRCSEGNPNNTNNCIRLLKGIREIGGQITEQQSQLGPITKQRVELETQTVAPEHRLKAYRCQ